MSCKIILTTHDGITVSGHVYCASFYNERFQAIRVSILGKEHTAWSVGENKTYTGDNIFLHLSTTIANEGILSGGGCEYPFKFTLPRDIPSSYGEKYGFISYSIEAKVEIPLGKDYKDKKFFKIISPINFNNITEQLQLNPIIYEAENPMLLFCRPLGLITMRVHLQKEAFVLGEVVKIKVDINNMSYNNNGNGETHTIAYFDSTEVYLQHIKFKVTSPKFQYKEEKEILTLFKDSGVVAHGQRTYEFSLEIPRTSRSPNFVRCVLFEKKCITSVRAKMPGCNQDLKIKPVILLGNKPVESQINTVVSPRASTTNIQNKLLF